MTHRVIHVALAGNPNSGKTSIFNQLTGLKHRVANYPGVTVETLEGARRVGDLTLRIVDLPGTYNLTAASPEEQIARNHLIRERPEVVVQVIDASNLERSLYLTTQLLELGVRLVLDLNMVDESRRRGMTIHAATIARRLGVEVVETVANRGIGIGLLAEAILRAAGQPAVPSRCRFDQTLEPLVDTLSVELRRLNGGGPHYPARWAAVKYLEDDPEIRDWLGRRGDVDHAALGAVRRSFEDLADRTGDSAEAILAQARYGLVSEIYYETVLHPIASTRRPDVHERIDAIVLNRWLGIPLFLAIMFVLFQLVFTLGEPLTALIEDGFTWLGALLHAHMTAGPLRSLLLDGVLGGVGGVLVFVPNVVLLFIGIGLMEKSGYMARAAMIMDRVMHKIGLHGRSFIPMLTGFGCSVPAILATRTLEHERDRLATMLVIPLMSCSARLPIYTLLIPAFFPLRWRGLMFFLIYVIGILLAIAVVKLLRVTVLAGEATPFVMELPPYRTPTFSSIVADMTHKSLLYVRKAGTIVLAISIILWAASSYPRKTAYEIDADARAATLTPAQLSAARANEALAYSLTGRVGRAMETVFHPAGFDWRVCTALIGALAAKEVFVAQLGIVYAIGEGHPDSRHLRAVLARGYSPLQGFCVMLFCLVGAPCMATIAVTRRESNSWKWPLLQFLGLTGLAYMLTVVVYQVGLLLGIGA